MRLLLFVGLPAQVVFAAILLAPVISASQGSGASRYFAKSLIRLTELFPVARFNAQPLP
jgi:hypothetical protein